jgi:hypothetical protein
MSSRIYKERGERNFMNLIMNTSDLRGIERVAYFGKDSLFTGVDSVIYVAQRTTVGNDSWSYLILQYVPNDSVFVRIRVVESEEMVDLFNTDVISGRFIVEHSGVDDYEYDQNDLENISKYYSVYGNLMQALDAKLAEVSKKDYILTKIRQSRPVATKLVSAADASLMSEKQVPNIEDYISTINKGIEDGAKFATIIRSERFVPTDEQIKTLTDMGYDIIIEVKQGRAAELMFSTHVSWKSKKATGGTVTQEYGDVELY